MRIGNEAHLTTFTPFGFPEPVNKIRAIGHGESYGALFLKKLWNQSMNMEQTAKLGIFIIKFIQDMKLDNSVGFDNEFPPQVFYIPDVTEPSPFEPREKYEEAFRLAYETHPIRELDEYDVNHFINEVGAKIAEFEELFRRGQFKL